MAYLEEHLRVHPEELAALQGHAKRGALRIVGGGMTSPDTLLPESEVLFRDLLYGVRFSEDVLGVTPHAAWLPDSFGHAGTVPDVLRAAGFDAVAFSRIDGSPSIFQKIFHPDTPPLPGSTADLLQRLGSADFTWRGPSGGGVLAHFIAGMGLYCEGENVDYDEHLETPGGHIGDFKGDDPSFTDARLDGYVAENTPYARTPYLFVPVGCDFEPPKPRLVEYADGYDARRYPDTGVWVVAATFEQYATLVGFWSDVLPTIAGDLAPTYMGFYGSRADLKRAIRDAARPFFVAEAFATALGDAGTTVTSAAAPQLALLTRTDHHDFVPGTSTDAVVSSEQMPLLAQAGEAGQSAEAQVAQALLARVAPAAGAVGRVMVLDATSTPRDDVVEALVPLNGAMALPLHGVGAGGDVPLEVAASTPTTATLRLALAQVAPWSWSAIDLLPGAAATPPAAQVALAMTDAAGAPATGGAVAHVTLSNARVRAQVDRGADGGFALTSVAVDGATVLAGPSLTVVDYQDDGGLWRLGDEMGPGCHFTPQPPAPRPSSVQVLASGSLAARVAFTGGTYAFEVALAAGQDALDAAVTTGAAQGTTRTVALTLPDALDTMTTSSPAGYEAHASQRVFDPTFYPAVAWVQLDQVAVLLRQSTGARIHQGTLELMAARDARTESCDVMGGTGSDPGVHRVEWRIAAARGPAGAERAAQSFDRPLDAYFDWPSAAVASDLPARASLVTIDGDAVVTAIKPAERGDGVIVRALLLAPTPATLTLGSPLAGRSISLVDLAERDQPTQGALASPLTLDRDAYGSIASFRLR